MLPPPSLPFALWQKNWALSRRLRSSKRWRVMGEPPSLAALGLLGDTHSCQQWHTGAALVRSNVPKGNQNPPIFLVAFCRPQAARARICVALGSRRQPTLSASFATPTHSGARREAVRRASVALLGRLACRFRAVSTALLPNAHVAAARHYRTVSPRLACATGRKHRPSASRCSRRGNSRTTERCARLSVAGRSVCAGCRICRAP